ncbi:hypothetical protein ABMA27_010327 [Loxostege sticticalis]|uniref:Endonuclease/exonuclease/phosphatase domain-containing protein n=1 Tax=Loxostege sticticalis TaxID=481309 RepID=A0ABR3H5C6_LOXSC
MLKVFYQNVNRIRSKTKEVYLNILNNNYDVICLTETNLNSSVFDCELMDNRYNIFRRDRCTTSISKGDGGGLLIGIKKTFNVIRRNIWDSKVEDLWVTILSNTNSCKSVNVCVCYLPPDISSELLSVFYNSCIETVLKTQSTDEFIIIGDFNTPNMTWLASSSSLDLSPNCITSDIKTNCLLELMTLCNLKQYNGNPNQNNRCLDLVLSTFDCAVSVTDPVSLEDVHHPPLAINFNFPTTLKSLERKRCRRFNYKKTRFFDLNKDIEQTDWHLILSSDDVDRDVDCFYTRLNELIEKHTPLTKYNPTSFPPWFSFSLKQCIKEKLKCHKLYKKYKNPHVSNLRIFGSKVMVHIPKERRQKLDRKATQCILVVYNPNNNSITIARDIVVIEEGIEEKQDVIHFDITEDSDNMLPMKDEQEECTQEVGGMKDEKLLEDQEQKEMLSPKVEISGAEEEEFEDSTDILEAEPPEPGQDRPLQSEPHVELPAVTKRISKRPDRYGFSNVCVGQTSEMSASDISLDEALNGSESEQWKLAMEREFKAFSDNDAWELVDVPPNSTIVQCFALETCYLWLKTIIKSIVSTG